MRIRKHKELDFTGQVIYVGIDVGKTSWMVSIYTRQGEHKTCSRPPSVDSLVQYLRTWFPNGRYLVGFEAGFCGFWIYEEFTCRGLLCRVFHPADIPTTDKDRAFKSNARDARKIARLLMSEELDSLYVPSHQRQEERALVRMRYRLVQKQTRCKNQIKSLLAAFGLHCTDEQAEAYWSNRYIGWLEGLAAGDPEVTKAALADHQHRQGNGPAWCQALGYHLHELRFLRQELLAITRQIRRLAGEEYYQANVQLLVGIPGISTLSAMIFLVEIVDIHRFPTLDALASYCGLIPGESSTGDEENQTGVTRRRNGYLRHILIESAWVAVRKDPALLQKFHQLKQKGKRAVVAIVRIARKLLARMLFVLVHQQPYQYGMVDSSSTRTIEGKGC